MIKLCLEGDYCHDCPEFKANIDTIPVKVQGITSSCDTLIKCEYRLKCRRIHDFLLKNQRGDKDGK